MKFEPIHSKSQKSQMLHFHDTKFCFWPKKGSFINMEPNDPENHETVNHILSKYDNIKNVSSLHRHPNSLVPLKQT